MDYNKQIPAGTRRASSSNGGLHAGVGWAYQIMPYARDISLYACPFDETKPLTGRSSYALNSNLVASVKTRQRSLKHPDRTIMLAEVAGEVTDLTRPYDPVTGEGDGYSAAGNGKWGNGLYPVISMDGNGKALVPLWDTGPFAGQTSGATQTTPEAVPLLKNATATLLAEATITGNGRHMNSALYAFADGHVKWFNATRVCAGADAKKPGDPPNPVLGLACGTERFQYKATFSTR